MSQSSYRPRQHVVACRAPRRRPATILSGLVLLSALIGVVWRVAVDKTDGSLALAATVLAADRLANSGIRGINVYLTRDGGRNWTVVDRGLDNVDVHALLGGQGSFLAATGDGLRRLDLAGGVVVPPAPLLGDLNGDGKVNVSDATLALQIAVALITPSAAQVKAGDVAPAGKPDGKITVSDATRILRAAVGLEKL